ncbi:MAG: hypothetical protein WEB57_08060 [Pseudohongiellaceae bacterium]
MTAPRVHLVHGFNVSDGGSDTVGKLAPYFALQGFEVVDHDYGWVFLLRLRRRNEKVVRRLEAECQPGDVLIGHSNGALLCWEALHQGCKPSSVICIQPAMRKDTHWPESIPVLCLFNRKDRIVSLGRAWSRFISVANPFRNRHGWGAAGRHGFVVGQPNVRNQDTDQPPVPARGHSGIFGIRELLHWGPRIQRWATHQLTRYLEGIR